jgi:polysaccharide export outer membrane protein
MPDEACVAHHATDAASPIVRRYAIAAAALLFLASCAPGGDLAPLPDQPPTGYRLGAGDQIRIITFGDDQLSGQFRIDDQGEIDVPLLGPIHAADDTPEQLAAHLSADLKRKKLLLTPSVAVEVVAYRNIFVLGEVNKPGSYPYQPGMTMLTAVAVAGGFTYRAFEAYASDVRSTSGTAVEGKITPHSFLAPGDVVKIYERHF